MTNLLDCMIEIADSRGMKAPEGLTWGFRSVYPDLTSKNGFRWSMPGKWTHAPGHLQDILGPRMCGMITTGQHKKWPTTMLLCMRLIPTMHIWCTAPRGHAETCEEIAKDSIKIHR